MVLEQDPDHENFDGYSIEGNIPCVRTTRYRWRTRITRSSHFSSLLDSTDDARYTSYPTGFLIPNFHCLRVREVLLLDASEVGEASLNFSPPSARKTSAD